MTRSAAAGHSPNAAVSQLIGLAVRPETGEPEACSLNASLAEVYRVHFPTVWRGLRRLGVPSSLQEDAVQDVFLVVYRRWEDFEGRSALQTWIYGIMLRVAQDYRRAQLRHANRMQRLAEFGAAEPGASSSPSEEVERREANRLVHGVLAALTDEHREVIVLVELEQLPVREAAAALGIRVRACQRRLRAARLAFDAQLTLHVRLPGGSDA